MSVLSYSNNFAQYINTTKQYVVETVNNTPVYLDLPIFEDCSISNSATILATSSAFSISAKFKLDTIISSSNGLAAIVCNNNQTVCSEDNNISASYSLYSVGDKNYARLTLIGLASNKTLWAIENTTMAIKDLGYGIYGPPPNDYIEITPEPNFPKPLPGPSTITEPVAPVDIQFINNAFVEPPDEIDQDDTEL
jgi:hypothetical protein